MTIIAVRDGVMAVDSFLGGNDKFFGYFRKFAAVPAYFGGGFWAGSGDASFVSAILSVDDPKSAIGHEHCNMVWLLADGTVRVLDAGGWIEFEAPFYAEGSGTGLAMGAMAHGATAEEAAKIACQYSQTCGGEVHVLSVADGIAQTGWVE